MAVLTKWHPKNDRQRQLKAAYLNHLAEHSDGMFRDCHPDHITASTLIVSSDRAKVLLNLHRKYQIWVQFGGHCEPTDATLAGAALREAAEESGISGLRPLGAAPTQLSTHEVECGPIRPSHHLDVRYVAVAPAGAEAKASQESIEVGWFGRKSLPKGLDASLRELIEWSRWL